jgi:O-antigen/teichoic acid export membrane protein
MSILRNSAWNVVGVVIPSLFVIPSLAIYSRALGVELLGVLMLTFSIVGYATSFDFGLSRALIRQVSIHIDDKEVVKTYMGTTTAFVGVVSLVIAAVTWIGSTWLSTFLSISSAHRNDATNGFHWVSLSVPPYLLSLVATAYFEGKEDFRALNGIRCAASALNALAGVVCVYWYPTLESVMAALCGSRWLSCIVVFALYRTDVNRHDPVPRPAIWTFDAGALRSSLSYGGWLTVSNVIGPVMSHFDRFALSHLAGAQIVAFYTVPAEIIGRLSLVPVAISKALFPRLSKGHHTAAADRRIGFLLTLVCSVLTILPVFAFAGNLLRLWMGPAYGAEPATVLRILLVGFFFLSMSFGPFTDLQARGHSKTTAFIHAVELFPYLGGLILLTHLYGIVGTAIAWSARTFVDYVLMETYSRRLSNTGIL